MRKLFYTIFLVSLFFISCEDELNPFGEVKDKYVVNLILRGDTTYQAATLLKSFAVEGFDPYANKEDQTVKGADIRVWQGDSVYVFKEITTDSLDNSRYQGSSTIYVNDKFRMDEKSADIEVEVLLPFGKRLKAFSKTPPPVDFDVQNSTATITGLEDKISMYWTGVGGEVYYQSRLVIRYFKESENRSVSHKIIVPIRYEQKDGTLTAIHEKPSTNIAFFKQRNIIDQTMELIAEPGVLNKLEYAVDAAYFEILSLDKPLSNYYISTNSELDGFSIRVDGTDFTNIDGGFGIFGSYRFQEKRIKIFREYIESFGYQAANPD